MGPHLVGARVEGQGLGLMLESAAAVALVQLLLGLMLEAKCAEWHRL